MARLHKAALLSGWMMAALCLVLAETGRSDVILGIHDWDPNPDPNNWTAEYGWATFDVASPGGNTGAWLRITFPSRDPHEPHNTWADIFHTPANSLFGGAYETNMWFSFDFWQSNSVANALQVRWKSTTNDYIWGNVITVPSSTGEWTTVRSATLNNWDSWDIDPIFGNAQEQFLADLQTIEWVGVYIRRSGIEEQIYGIDNFRLVIPEPSEYMFLVAAFGAVLSSRRRWLAWLKARIGHQ